MRFRLEFHPLVRADLIEAAVWYESQQQGLGERFEAEARTAFRKIGDAAQLYSVRFQDIRRINLPSFPIGVFYFVTGSAAVILAVIHGARDSQAELERRRSNY